MKFPKGKKDPDTSKVFILIADAYEAFVGKLYLDQGYSVQKNLFQNTTVRTETLFEKDIKIQRVLSSRKSLRGVWSYSCVSSVSSRGSRPRQDI